MTDKDYLKQAVEQAKISVKKGGFPAGAVLVKSDQVIAEGVSLGSILHDPTSHAETSSVRQACQKLQTTDLSGCVLYASLQPCVMCYCSANWARVSRIVYGCQKTEAMIQKEYYEGQHDLQNINTKSTHHIELMYLPDFESEMLELITEWEQSL